MMCFIFLTYSSFLFKKCSNEASFFGRHLNNNLNIQNRELNKLNKSNAQKEINLNNEKEQNNKEFALGEEYEKKFE